MLLIAPHLAKARPLLLLGLVTWAEASGPPSYAGLCVDTCMFTSDGDCDDGGEGQEYQCAALRLTRP